MRKFNVFILLGMALFVLITAAACAPQTAGPETGPAAEIPAEPAAKSVVPEQPVDEGEAAQLERAADLSSKSAESLVLPAADSQTFGKEVSAASTADLFDRVCPIGLQNN